MSVRFLPVTLAAVVALGCSDEAPAPVILEIHGSMGASALWVWIKAESNGVRLVQTPDGTPQEVALPAGWDLSATPYRLSLDPGRSAPSSLFVHLVAHVSGRPVGSADLRVTVGTGAVVQDVALLEWRADCDRDGDTFFDCGLAGCCEHLPEALRETFGDCADNAAVVAASRSGPGCRDVLAADVDLARSAHPFRPVSYAAGLAACDDCVDQDCTGGDDVCDFADTDGDGSEPPYDCDDEDHRRYPEARELCNGLDDD